MSMISKIFRNDCTVYLVKFLGDDMKDVKFIDLTVDKQCDEVHEKVKLC